MRTVLLHACRVALVAAAWLGPAPAARADTQGCTVLATLPATISVPGNYCLSQHVVKAFANSDNGILIDTDRVVLDCRGRIIRNTTLTNGQAGVRIADQRQGVTVRNCTLDGFYYGIYLSGFDEPGTTGNTVQDNVVLRARYHGIEVWGSRNAIVGNRVAELRGDTAGNAVGIHLASWAYGVGSRIEGNTVVDFRPEYTGFQYTIGIHVTQQRDLVVADNHVSGLHARTGNGVYGISGTDLGNAVFRDNTVLSPPPLAAPFDGGNYYGMFFSPADPPGSALCRDNVVGHFNTGIDTDCTLVDNTVF